MGFRLSIPPRRLCTRAKRRHHSRAEAEGMIAFLRFAGRDQPEKGELHSYWCDQCGAYHIGHRQHDRN